jgi:DNA polymerase-3 subunit epsilon
MLLASTPLREARFAIVDLETTGASAVYDRVTEIAVVRVAGGRIVESYDSLVNPGVRIPPFITRLTGIDDRMVAGQPRLGELVPRIAQELDDAVFVAHNASFDWAFLKQGFARVGGRLEPERLCTVRLARRLVPGLRSYRLDALRERFGISTPGRHRARPDAEATAALLLELLELAERAGVRTVGALLRLQGRPIAGRARRSSAA